MKLISVGLTLRSRCCCSFGYCRRRRSRGTNASIPGPSCLPSPRRSCDMDTQIREGDGGETVIKRNKGGGEPRAAVVVGGRRKRTTPSHKSTPFIFPLDPLFSQEKDFEFPKPPRLIGEQNGIEKGIFSAPNKIMQGSWFFSTYSCKFTFGVPHTPPKGRREGKKQWWPRGGKTG